MAAIYRMFIAHDEQPEARQRRITMSLNLSSSSSSLRNHYNCAMSRLYKTALPINYYRLDGRDDDGQSQR